MRSVLALLLAFFVVGTLAGEVVELDVEQLLEIAHGDNDDSWFIKFYGPNCGFCKGMAAEWQAFADEVEAEGLDIKVAQYDVHAPENKDARVQTFFPGPLPGLHFFPPGDKKFYEFPNPRINVRTDFYMNFALFEYEEYPGVYRKQEYLYEEESPIVTIPGEQFDEYLATEQDYFVMFFGPKCGWCKQLMPMWENFAEEALEKESPFVVARMDGFTGMPIIERYTARPWPSLVYVSKGRFYRLDTEEVRELTSTEQIFSWIESGEYLEADEEHSGEDKGYFRYLKLKAAKEKSKQRKKEKDMAAEEL